MVEMRARIIDAEGGGDGPAPQAFLNADLQRAAPTLLIGAGVDDFLHVQIELVDVEQPAVQVRRQENAAAEVALIPAVQQPQIGLENIGMREDRGPVLLEPAFGQRAVAGQLVVDVRQRQGEVVVLVQIAHFGEQLSDVALREVSKPVLEEQIPGHEVVELAAAAAGLQQRPVAGEAAAPHLRGRAGIGHAALGARDHGAAQRVAAIDRVGARNDFQPVDRVHGNQVPVDLVGQGFVDAYAVHEDAEPRRRADQKRTREPAVGQVGLERIVLHVGQVDAAQVARQRVGQAERAAFGELLPGHDLHVGRHLFARHRQAHERRGAADFDGGQADPRLGVCAGEAGEGKGENGEGNGEGKKWHTVQPTRRPLPDGIRPRLKAEGEDPEKRGKKT